MTNLDDSGPGSLRAAIEDEEGPRIVVFEVGGIITLERDLTINSETQQITIAGQTAPYPGITIRNHKFAMSGARDAVMRFLRLKVSNMSGETSDGTGMSGSDNSIMDHLSVGWSLDEAFSSRTAHNITLQRTMLEEALNQAGHKNYPVGSRHGFAASVGGDIASFHHNLLAHCAGRNWSMAGGLSNGVYAGRLDFTNNVVYNWDNRTTDGGAHEVNFVANYYRGGPATRNLNFLNPQHEKLGTSTQRYYVAGNIMDVVPIPGINDRHKYVGPENQSDSYTTDSEFPFAYVDQPFFTINGLRWDRGNVPFTIQTAGGASTEHWEGANAETVLAPGQWMVSDSHIVAENGAIVLYFSAKEFDTLDAEDIGVAVSHNLIDWEPVKSLSPEFAGEIIRVELSPQFQQLPAHYRLYRKSR